jgi:hypothetical protein
MNERRRNVIENKGPVRKICAGSRNVIENKDSYARKPGILLKIQVVRRWEKQVPGVRFQVPAYRGCRLGTGGQGP